jgi:hypothetical protein
MSLLNTTVTAPLAAAILLVSVAAGGSANAAAGAIHVKNPTPDIEQRVGHRHGRHHGGRWDGRGPGRWGRMGPRQIKRSLRQRGFQRIRILDVRGPVYVVKARGWRGRKVRLVVDAFNGQILRRNVTGRHYQYQWGYRW